jgi:hypothetical protein
VWELAHVAGVGESGEKAMSDGLVDAEALGDLGDATALRVRCEYLEHMHSVRDVVC